MKPPGSNPEPATISLNSGAKSRRSGSRVGIHGDAFAAETPALSINDHNAKKPSTDRRYRYRIEKMRPSNVRDPGRPGEPLRS